MLRGVGLRTVQILNRLTCDRGESFNLPSVVVIAISVREMALSSGMFPGFSKVATTRLLSRSGDSTA
jgi:hypothetical protein